MKANENAQLSNTAAVVIISTNNGGNYLSMRKGICFLKIYKFFLLYVYSQNLIILLVTT